MSSRQLRVSFSFVLGVLALGLTLALLWAWSPGGGLPVAHAEPSTHPAPSHPVAATVVVTRYVSSVSGDDTGNDCRSSLAPCASIQHAVEQANPGDTILIATYDVSGSIIPPSIITTSAIYTGSGPNVITVGKSVTLRGGYVYAHITGLSPTWQHTLSPAPVSGEGAYRPLYISGDITPSIEFLAFVNGSASQGGNVYVEQARVRFLATPIMSGSATSGGGLYLKDCALSFDPGDVDWEQLVAIGGLIPVRGNSAQYGGGIYIESGSPVLSSIAVTSNTAGSDGGGFYIAGGRPVIAGGLVMENQAANRGGGFFLGDSPARIAGVAVYSNTAATGAGFYLDGPFAFSEEQVPIIINNYIRHNRASGNGGGVYFHQTIAGLVNNIIADNHAYNGAAMYLWASSPQLFHNTIAQNSGNSGIYLTNKPGSVWPPVTPIPSQPSFTNTIVATHTTGLYVADSDIPGVFQNKAHLEGTLWWGNDNDWVGGGDIIHSNDVYSDPLFTCTGHVPDCLRPYHILTDSAAVDMGVPVALTLPGSDLFVDVDLQLRPSGEGYDIGADEVVSETLSVWLVPPISTLGAVPGETVTHTHQLMNTGLATDTYDLSFLSHSGWATLLGETVITLSAQASETVQVRVSVPISAANGVHDRTLITATSRTDADRHGRALDVTRVVTGDVTDLSIAKWAAEDGFEMGGAVHFTIVVTNVGPLTDTLAVTLTDTAVPTEALAAWSLPSGCSGDIGSGAVICTRTLPGGRIPVSDSLTLVITTTETYTGLLVNTVSVGADGIVDPHPGNNVAHATVGVTTPVSVCTPLLDVTIHGPTAGYTGTYNFAALVEPLQATPPITYFWAPQPSGSAVLPGGSSSVVTYTWDTTGTKVITVTAVNCAGAGEGRASDVHTITLYGPEVALVDLAVDKRADVTAAHAGDSIRYTIHLTKSGASSRTIAVTLTDTVVPTDALAQLTWPHNCTGTLDSGVVVCQWDLPGEAPIVTRTFTIALTTTQIYSGVLENRVIIAADAPDPSSDNNSDRVILLVSTPGGKIYLPVVLRNH